MATEFDSIILLPTYLSQRDTMSTELVFHLPDTLRNWPWPRRINPFYEVCKKESQGWCEAFVAFSPNAQTSFNGYDVSKMNALGPMGRLGRSQSDRMLGVNSIFRGIII